MPEFEEPDFGSEGSAREEGASAASSQSRLRLVRNERRKLTATWLNALSAASIAVGGFAQLVQFVNGAATSLVAAFSLIWVLSGLILHLTGRAVLGRLEE